MKLRKPTIIIASIIGIIAGGVLALNGYFGGGASIPSDTFTRGLVGYWSFDEGAGQTAYDASGNGNNGTIYGAKYTTPDVGGSLTSGVGPSGNALQFDGVDDYVDCGNDESLEVQEHTVEFWIKYSGTVGGWSQILAKHAPGSDRSPGIWANPSKTCLHWKYNPGNEGAECLGPNGDNTEFSLNQWYHITGVKSGTTLKIFINGEQKGPDYSVPDPITQGTGNFYIGKTDHPPFNGTIDEVRIYNRALSAEEIRYHYNHGGPVAHWRFDEGSGSTVYDSSGNENNGSLHLGTSGNTTTSNAWVTGKHGSAIKLDGKDDYIDFGDVDF